MSDDDVQTFVKKHGKRVVTYRELDTLLDAVLRPGAAASARLETLTAHPLSAAGLESSLRQSYHVWLSVADAINGW
jgi:hypothetical protein